MTSVEVRQKLVHAIGLDLVGPDRNDADLLGEVLPQAPSRWYLTGFLVPTDTDPDQKTDDTGDEGNDELGTDDEDTPEPAAARKAFFQSSMGMSLLVPKDAKEMKVTIHWGDYVPEGVDIEHWAAPEESDTDAEAGNLQFTKWRRTERVEDVTLKLPATSQKPK